MNFMSLLDYPAYFNLAYILDDRFRVWIQTSNTRRSNSMRTAQTGSDLHHDRWRGFLEVMKTFATIARTKITNISKSLLIIKVVNG